MRRRTRWFLPSLSISVLSILAVLQAQALSEVDPAPSELGGIPSDPEYLVPQPETSSFPLGTVVDSYGTAVLSEFDAGWGTIYILRVNGEDAQIGYQYGRLVGRQIPATWESLMAYMGRELGMTMTQAERLLGPRLDRAWDYLEPYIATRYIDEIEAIADGAQDIGVSYVTASGANLHTVLQRIVALTNVSDLNAFNEGASSVGKMLITGTSAELDAFYKGQQGLRTGAPDSMPADGATGRAIPALGGTCSFFASWGPRTEDNKLFASRNLDWATDTGIASSALVTVYKPTDGYAYVTFGYAGMVGALAGMNEAGVVVSEVGSTSVLEKLNGEPWTLKFRDILAGSESLETAMPLVTNDGSVTNRPTTIGYNFMVGYGDPLGAGDGAEAAVFETNGGTMSVFQQTPDCFESSSYYTYDRDGRVDQRVSSGLDKLLNGESEAVEIDGEGNTRYFKVQDGTYVRDADGYLVEDPSGSPLPTGLTLSCSLYRGDEALGYAARMYQTAANGPSGDDPREVLIDSSSYNNRYAMTYGILDALWTGGAYSDSNGNDWVQEGAAMREVGVEEALILARAAALDSNILSVVYDATGLQAYIAYESGTGDSWTRAADNSYATLDLAALFAWE